MFDGGSREDNQDINQKDEQNFSDYNGDFFIEPNYSDQVKLEEI